MFSMVNAENRSPGMHPFRLIHVAFPKAVVGMDENATGLKTTSGYSLYSKIPLFKLTARLA